MNKLLYILFFFQLSWIAPLEAQVIWNNKKHDVDSLVPQAVRYLREGKLDQSIMLSRTVLATYPDYTDFTYILGLSYQKMGKFDWAIPNFESVLAKDANYKDSYLPLALSYERVGDWFRAKQVWQRALQRFPKDTAITEAYREFKARETLYISSYQMDDWYKKGRESIASGDTSKVFSYADSMENLTSNDNRSLYLRSAAFMLNKEYNKAKSTYELLRSRGDSSVFVREQLSNIAAANKDYVLALDYIEPLRRQFPDHTDYGRLSRVYRENLPYHFYLGLNHMQSAQDRPNGHFFISGLEYGQRLNKKDVLIGQFNYGNRRGDKGYQAGLDAWINYGPSLYAYHHIAWADGAVFPTWRAAYSIYREAGSWLFDVGGRYVRSADHINNYGMVASAGRYIGPTFIYLRGFLLHDAKRWNQAYSLSLRHYYNSEKPDSYVTIIGNIGTSPDDPSRYQFLNNSYGFLSRSINAGWQHRIDSWGFTLMGGWSYYKVAEGTFMNQYDLNLSLKKYF
ncbi:YaiO family outer membrane beta-barrel protein [Sphingobacterium sp.]|uniref:YaiO family outer membrane beta-barrel protein n=1 Tax=Sphingobacterium sp. TaxID=341027 RepID=UPI0031D09C3D